MATKLWLGDDAGNEGDWGVAANWSPAGVPVNADDVILENSEQDVSGTLDQSAVSLDSLRIDQSFLGLIGTAAAYLQIGASVVTIGLIDGPGTPAGSGRIKLNLGAVASEVTILRSSNSQEDANLAPIRLLLNNAASNVYARSGNIGIAVEAGEVSVINDLEVSHVDGHSQEPTVVVGTGVTMGDLAQHGGDVTLLCAAVAITKHLGTLRTEGSGTITSLAQYDGAAVLNNVGAIAALDLHGGTVDLTENREARTITTPKIWPGAEISYDPAVITFTNPLAAQVPVKLVASDV